MKKKLASIGIALFTVFFAACGKNGAGEGNPAVDSGTLTEITGSVADNNDERTYTLMVYMIGSDLEAAGGAASADMAEIADNAIDFSKMNVVVYTGGSPKWHSDVSDSENAVYQLTENGYELVESFELTSMGDPENLTKFLNYAYDNYKTDSYSLILWDHGNGPVMGYGLDKKFDNDALTLPEIKTALEASPFGADNKLSFIGFDACLMSSLELAVYVNDYADILIASQEVEPSFGWNYDFVSKCTSLGTEELSKAILDSYVEFNSEFTANNPLFDNEVTLAAIDLSYALQLEEKVNNLFKKAADNVSGNFVAFANNRCNTRGFGRAATGSEYDLVDIVCLIDTLSESYPNECAEIRSVIDSMVIGNGNNTVDSCGISLYYPYYNKKYYQKSWMESYKELGILPDYQTYLDRYAQVWLGTDMKSFFDEDLTAEQKSKGKYTLTLSKEQAERVGSTGFFILKRVSENGYKAVYYSKNTEIDDNVITAYFDNKIIYFTNDYGSKFIPFLIERETLEDITTYSTYPVLTNYSLDFSNIENPTRETISAELLLTVNNDTDEVKIVGLYEDTAEELSTGKKKPLEFDILPIMSFPNIKNHMLTRDENGIIENYFDWPQDQWSTRNYNATANGYGFEYDYLYDDGNEYYLMFDIRDVQGNKYGTELFPIALDDAPEKQAPVVEELVWGDSNELLITNENNVDVYLVRENIDYCLYDNYYFLVVNNNDFAVDFSVDRLTLNDEYYMFLEDSPHIFALPSNTYDIVGLECLNEIIAYSGSADIDSLSFTIDITNLKTYGHLYAPKNIKVDIPVPAGESDYCFDNASRTTVLVDSNIARIEFIETAEPRFGKTLYLLKVQNFSNGLLSVDARDLVINGEFTVTKFEYDFLDYFEYTISENSTKYFAFTPISDALLEGEVEELNTLDMVLKYYYYDKAAQKNIGEDNIAVNLNLKNGAAVGMTWVPFMDYEADRQVLEDDDRVKITLLKAGMPLVLNGNDTISNILEIEVEIENKTEEDIPVDLGAFIVNGITVDDIGTIVSGAKYYTILPAGRKCILRKAISKSDFEKCNISSIESLKVQVLTDVAQNTTSFEIEGGLWYEVKPSVKGTATPITDKGKLLYSDENIDLYLLGLTEMMGWTSDTVPAYYGIELYAENKSGTDISIRDSGIYYDDEAPTEGGFFSTNVGVKVVMGAYSSAYSSITFSNDNGLSRPKFSAKLMICNQGGGALYYEIPVIIDFE